MFLKLIESVLRRHTIRSATILCYYQLPEQGHIADNLDVYIINHFTNQLAKLKVIQRHGRPKLIARHNLYQKSLCLWKLNGGLWVSRFHGL